MRNILLISGLTMLAVLVAVVAGGPLLIAHGPLRVAADSIGLPLPPQALYPCGTDELGRDVLARLLYGGRTTLLIAFSATLGALLLGTIVGLSSGYVGGWVDAVLMRATDVVLAFPILLLAIALAALFEPSLVSMFVVIMLVSWTGIARAVRSEVLSLRERDFVTASGALGAGAIGVIWRHLLPNALPTIAVLGALNTSNTILLESALSYLGLGVPVPLPSWGRMISDSQMYFRVAPWLMFFPGLAIVYTVAAFNFVGHGLLSASRRNGI